MAFDTECELGPHSVRNDQNRPSNIARRVHFEVFAHSVLISLKSGLDRLISVLTCYYPGIAPTTTWGRIKAGKGGFMKTVERDRQNDELLEYLFNEYSAWIAAAVAPRDDVIHYTDLQTEWFFRFNGDDEDPEITPVHGSSQVPGLDANVLSGYVKAYYALADRVLLTLATRVPRKVAAMVRERKEAIKKGPKPKQG